MWYVQINEYEITYVNKQIDDKYGRNYEYNTRNINISIMVYWLFCRGYITVDTWVEFIHSPMYIH